MSFHNNWRKFLAEGKFEEKKLLREIDEEELGHIERALDELGPQDLAFSHLFGEKNRVLIPFMTKDSDSELGKFVQLFETMGYSVDWNKGLISGEQEFPNKNPDAILDLIMNRSPSKPQTKKITMKIGKFFKKLKDITRKFGDLISTVQQFEGTSMVSQEAPVSQAWRALTGKEVEDALTEEGVEQYYRLNSQLEGYLGGNRSLVSKMLEDYPQLNYIDELSNYWQKNADFIKKNLDSLDLDTYAIVLTRNPVDVLRMSDFDNIQSCHSPRSRGGMGSYYKCAVAEAYGHGALAYVVNTADLREEYGTDDPVAIENTREFQEEEIFRDDNRDVFGELEPVSRLRLRQVRYYPNKHRGGEFTPKRIDAGIELAVPETRVYGANIPGFAKALDKWLESAQSSNIKAIAEAGKDEPAVEIGDFVKFGGSYGDTAISSLLNRLLNSFYDDNIKISFDGRLEQNTETEDQLDKQLDIGGLASLQARGAEIMNDFVQNTGRSRVANPPEVNYEDDGDGAYALPVIRLKFNIPVKKQTKDSFQAMKNAIDYLPQEINDYGGRYDIFAGRRQVFRPVGVEYTKWSGGVGEDKPHFRIFLTLDLSKFDEGEAVFYDADSLENAMINLSDFIRENYDGFEMLIEKFLMREGAIDGGALDELGRDVDGGEYRMSDWDIDTEEGDYEPHEFELISATIPLEIDFSKTTKDIAQKIIADRNFWIRIREFITDKARKEIEGNSGYQVDYDRFIDEVDEETNKIEFRLNFHVGGDDKDEQVEIFKEIIDIWDETDTMALVQKEFDKFTRAMNTDNPQSLQESNLRLRNRSREHRMFDKWRRFLK